MSTNQITLSLILLAVAAAYIIWAVIDHKTRPKDLNRQWIDDLWPL